MVVVMKTRGNEMMKCYYAHKAEDGRLQTVESHLEGTSVLAERFAADFGASQFGALVGMAHDIGKCCDDFQNRLNGGPIVDHSSAGAIACAGIQNRPICAICVAGHHSGLPDFGNIVTDIAGMPTLVGRIKAKKRDFYDFAKEFSLPETTEEPLFENEPFARSLWGRMLFSTLVDADYLDTEAFMKGKSVRDWSHNSLTELLDILRAYMRKYENPSSPLDVLRTKVRKDCNDSANLDRGLFSLTVPTGGGKTLSSMAFALNHAVKNGMSRIIYVIPYTSIIEQNAAVFASVFGSKNVLEHHSEVDFKEEYDSEDNWNPKLATENWDAPIIVTTAVQFFESFYSNRPSKTRKLHNVANSVVVFDEAQMIPTKHLLPCIALIGTLVKHFGVSAVLCTATQPFIQDIMNEYTQGMCIHEISTDIGAMFTALKRVEYNYIGKTNVDDLADKISCLNQVLCIVNTRKTARELFERLPDEGSFHLSTLMYPEHRKKVLNTIRKRLSAGLSCRVISTSLIEAGVDIDFPTVFREINGLDSIVQAAGRCNREGKRPAAESIVTVFELGKRNPSMVDICIGAARETIEKFEDIGSAEAIDYYFKAYRSLIGTGIDESESVKNLSFGYNGCTLPYKTVSENFHMIDQLTKTVYIPTADNGELLSRIKNGNADTTTFRLAGKYGVNVYERDYINLLESGDLDETDYGSAILINELRYDENCGLGLGADYGRAMFV